ncbi:MAG TPA: FtsH protease activity modulator HflK [Desulfovibrio sp.]|nr:FtsH protease activity modulator HflK [Desulfovibrio sp.]HBR06515.1 FtsH protease activity modulator HflK [Desulfovibrio sp.]
MNWDWEKLQEQQRRQRGPGQGPPDLGDIADKFKSLKGLRLPPGRILALIVAALWILSGIYIVEPDEIGVVQRFGAFDRTAGSGPHYHIPFPVESVTTPKVTRIQRMEFGFRTVGRQGDSQAATRPVPEESLMLTGDENIVDVQFTVQFVIKEPVDYLFNVADPVGAVRGSAEAAMREVMGKSKIDAALTSGKDEIQVQTRDLMQDILDRYKAGIKVVAVQMQYVHPPSEVIEAFKDVASAREDKSRFINEADAYRNDILPKARGQAAVITNEAEAYRESVVRKAQGETSRFLAVLTEYNKARDVTRQRLYLETMQRVLGNPATEKLVLTDKALERAVPYLPLPALEPKTAPEGVKKP